MLLLNRRSSIDASANLADVGLGKSIHEQLGSPTLKSGDKKEGARRASVVKDVARASTSSGRD
jgi:hypothetical protein